MQRESDSRDAGLKSLSRSYFITLKPKLVGLTLLALFALFAGGARAASPGALDLSFGDRGTAAFKQGSNQQRSHAVLSQPDGKIILAGYIVNCVVSTCSSDFLLVRFNTNGTLDTSFDSDGYVMTDNFGQDEAVFAAALQPDGKIVVAGGLNDVSNGINITGFKVMRYLPDGTPDSGFGTGGMVYETFDDLGGTPRAMLIEPDGKIVVVGSDGNSMLFIARFNPNGTLDTSFDTDGRIATSAYNIFQAELARQSDGKIIITGYSTPQGTVKLVRFNPNGTPDANFGMGGILTTTFTTGVSPIIAVQQDDKIIVSGSGPAGAGIPPLRRFNADGSLDNSFTPYHGDMYDDRCRVCTRLATRILTLPDGRFYLAGYYSSFDSLPTVVTVARYLSNGMIDRSYGFRGTSVVRHTNSTYVPLLIYTLPVATLAPDGKVVVAANADLPVGSSAQPHLVAIRLNATATAPSVRGDFDGDGKTDFAVFRPSSRFWYVLRSSDGTIYSERYGNDGDVLTPADYNYDLKTDLSVYRPTAGAWYISASLPSGGGTGGAFFASSGDVRVPEDYDGDGYADLAVFRPGPNTWTMRYRALVLLTPYQTPISHADIFFPFGLQTDKQVPADYDGDGRADLAVFRPSTGVWYVLRTSDDLVTAVNFGLGSDKLVPADYDGDLKTDIAVYRDGSWYILRSSDNAFVGIMWGLATDKPVPGDYDGDGKTDVAVFRPSEGAWYVLKSSDGGVMSQQWGISEDVPIPFTFVK